MLIERTLRLPGGPGSYQITAGGAATYAYSDAKTITFDRQFGKTSDLFFRRVLE
jgi:hypothetical protein